MVNDSVGPSARGTSAYGFSANERAEITRGMIDGEAPLAINVLSENVEENHHLAPRSQLDFIGWVQKNHKRIFFVDTYPTGAKSIEAKTVKGQTNIRIYGAEGFGGYYYAAWTECSGLFVGWLFVEATRMAKASCKFGYGQVGGRPVFGDMSDHTIRRSPVKRWIQALKDLDYAEVI